MCRVGCFRRATRRRIPPPWDDSPLAQGLRVAVSRLRCAAPASRRVGGKSSSEASLRKGERADSHPFPARGLLAWRVGG